MDDDDCRILPFRLPSETEETKIRRRAKSAAFDKDLLADTARLLSDFFAWLRDPSVAPEVRERRIRTFIEVSYQNTKHWT
jgi:hypothetical protein